MSPNLQHLTPSGPVRRLRFRRNLRRLLTALAATALAIFGPLGVLVLFAFFDSGADEDPLSLIVFIAAPFIIWIVYRMLRAAPRQQILYLRGFARTGSEPVVTVAATGALGRNYRLVTLDDAKLPPLGVPTWIRRRSWMAAIFGPLLFGSIAYWGWLGLDPILEDVMRSTFDSIVDQSGTGIGDIIGGIIAGLIGAFVVALVVGAILLIPILLLGGLGIWVGLHWLVVVIAIYRAERWKHSTINTEKDLTAFRKILRRRRRNRWAPRLLVVGVHDRLWKQVVDDVGGDSLGALLDLSHPSEGLYWETKHFFELDPLPCVLVAEETMFRDWFESDSPPDLVNRFRHLLQNRQIIPFNSDDHKSIRRFERSVQTAFDELALDRRR